ncbi:oxidoreductase [Nocardioides sp. B-3]|uniref:oxidoreductase n=1 Tax=Nocardioides sp. B-3 TaxID=2895565 RepID=UPI00300E0A61
MSSLNDPLDLPSGVRLRNRIAKASMSEAPGDSDNSPDDRIIALYRRWARGGYGLLITGNIMVDREHLGEPGNIVVDDDRALPQLTARAKAAHDGGAAIFAQLNHPGRRANMLAIGHTPVAPSPVALALPGASTPRELTDIEIEQVIDRFATAAAICEDAGFDGVQLHAAHGYLITQFLSPLTNLRTDEWGGTPRAADELPDRGRTPCARPCQTRFRRRREAQLRRLPARGLLRGRLACRGGCARRRGRGPDRGQWRQLRGAGHGWLGCRLDPGAGGLLPGLRPLRAARGRRRPDRGDRRLPEPLGDGQRAPVWRL